MLINEVVHKVGITRKSIRYYESVGLLSPSRNNQNDYRNYTEKEIKELKKIKFLRELNVPIKDLKLLKEEKLTLQACISERIKKIEKEQNNYQKIKDLCQEIKKENMSYQNIDIDKYFLEINKLNKEGFTMKKYKVNHTKKIIGATISSLLFLALFLLASSTITYFQITEQDKLPTPLYIIILLLFIIPIISIIINYISRIKEIKGGEEDEASKY